MKSVKFSDEQLELMFTQYQVELEEAKKYVLQVEDILFKLRKQITSEKQEIVKVPKKRGRKPGPKKVKTAEPKKRGRKPKVKVVESAPVAPKNEAKPKGKRGRKKGTKVTVKKATVKPVAKKPVVHKAKPVAKKKAVKKAAIKKGPVVKPSLSQTPAIVPPASEN